MSVRKITLSAFFLALCYVLPFLSGSIPVVGKMLCLMHIPVFLAGLLLGWQYGLFVGLIAPLTRSLFFGTPVFYPDAIVMAVELASYGAISALIYKWLSKKENLNKYVIIYISLISAMLIGRGIWGLTKALVLLPSNNQFTFSLFLSGAFLNAWPGIILQLVLIPLIVPIIEKILNLKTRSSDLQKN